MTEMFSITRASLRLMRAAWQLPLPSGAKLVLLCILSHYNDARGMAFPSLPRLAKMCGLHKRTVQAHIAGLEKNGVLQVGKSPGIHNHVYRINEAAWAQLPSMADDTDNAANDAKNIPVEMVLAAVVGGDFSIPRAEITTQNGSNEIQRIKTTQASPSTPYPAPAPPAPTSSSSLLLQALQSPEDQAALQAWQQVRRAKGRPALPNALQCQQLLHHAATLNKPVGWVVQVMALNDWALFDPTWLNNQRPPPRLPAVAAPPSSKAPAPESKATEQPPPRPVTAAETAQAKARMSALLEQWRGPQPAHVAPIQPCGIPWADNIIASALRGESVGFAALDMACSVAKVSKRAMHAAAKAHG